MTDPVNHPPHYTRLDPEPVTVIEAWRLDWHLGNAMKYIARAGHKGDEIEDLEKARWYLDRKIQNLRSARAAGKPTDGTSTPASEDTADSAGSRSTVSSESARDGSTPNGNDEHEWVNVSAETGLQACRRCGMSRLRSVGTLRRRCFPINISKFP